MSPTLRNTPPRESRPSGGPALEGDQKELFETIIENSREGLVVTSPVLDEEGNLIDLVFVLANPAAARLANTPFENVAGRRMSETFPGLFEIGAFEQFKKVYHSGVSLEDELLYDYNEQYKWFWVSVLKIREGLFFTFSDITEKKQARHELESGRRFLQQVADNNPGIILLYNVKKGKVEYANRTVETLLGYSPRFITLLPGEELSKSVHPDDVEGLRAEMKQAIGKASALGSDTLHFSAECRVRHRKGHYLWLFHQGVVFNRDENGQVERILLLSLDVTQQKETEQRLQLAETFNRQLADSLPSIILLYNLREGVVEYGNMAAATFFGNDFPSLELDFFGTLSERIHPDDVHVPAEIQNHFLKGRPGSSWHREYRLRNADGRYRWFFSRSQPMAFDEAGRPVKVLINQTDVTEIKEIQARLAELNVGLEKEAERQTKALRQSEEQLKVAQNMAKLGSWEVDMVEGTAIFSDEMYRIYDRDPAQVPSTLADVYSMHLEAGKVKQADKDLKEKHIPYHFDTPILTEKGALKHIEMQGSPVLDRRGRCIKIHGTVMDITARKKAEMALQENRQFLALLTENLPVLVAYFDEEAKFAFANNLYLKFFHLDDKEVVGQYLNEVHDQNLTKKLLPSLEHALKGTTLRFHEYVRLEGRYEQEYWIDVQLVPDTGKNGTIRGAIAVIADITDEERGRRALEEVARQRQQMLVSAERQRQRLLDLFMQMPANIAVLKGRNMEFEMVNSGYAQLFGTGLIGRTMREVFTQLPETLFLQLEEVFEKGKTFSGREFPLLWAQDGEESARYFDYSYIPLKGHDGKPESIVVYSHEVTPQVLQRKMLEETASYQHLVVESLPLLAIVTDHQGNAIFSNLSYESYTGINTSKKGQPYAWAEAIVPEQRQEVLQWWQSEEGFASQEAEVKFHRQADNSQRWHLLKATRMNLEKSEKPQYLLTAVDIDDQIRFQQLLENRVAERTVELMQANEDLKRSNSDLEQFAYVASHDLKEPIRMVSSYSKLIQNKYGQNLDKEGHAFLGFIMEGATRMQGLVDDLLEYSRVGRMQRAPVKVDLNETIEKIKHNLHVKIAATDAQIVADELPTVTAVESQLFQLFQNLIENAIKFRGPEPPLVQIGAEERGNEWVFWVKDNGIGIAPEYQDKIWVIFQRLHTRDKYEGTGIGLAICKKIVDLNGGKIWLESEEGQGTTFYFTWKKEAPVSGHALQEE